MKKFFYAPNISWQLLDNEIIIVNEKNKKVYLLQNTAKDFWLAIDGKNIDDIVSSLYREYSAEYQQLEKDLKEFYENLKNLDLIEEI